MERIDGSERQDQFGALIRPDGHQIAWRRRTGPSPTVVFVGGFRSDMTGTKARYLDDWAAKTGRAFLRFDGFGHGQSSGVFVDGTIGRWRQDLIAMLDALTDGPVVLIGSSMGVWLALLAALARPKRIVALIGIAGAPDFTEDLLLPALPAPMRDALFRDGVVLVPSEYGEPYPIALRLIEEARHWLVLRAPIPMPCAVRLIHGMEDRDVPWQTSLRLADTITAGDVRLTLIKDGDHRLSRDADLAVLADTIAEFC